MRQFRVVGPETKHSSLSHLSLLPTARWPLLLAPAAFNSSSDIRWRMGSSAAHDEGQSGIVPYTTGTEALMDPGDMLATPQQTAAAEAGDLPLVDVQEVADRFKAWRCQDRLGYIQHLQSRAPLSKLAQPGSQLPPNVQPSQLQLKLCGRSNKLSQTLLPACNPDGLTLLDWPADAQPSSSSPNSINWQFGLLLLNATHVGPTGFPPAVQPVWHVARCCIFDRQNNRFLGNVHTIPASQAKAHRGLGSLGSFWTWDSTGPQGCPGPAADGTLSDLISQQPPRLDPIRPGELVGASSTPGGVGAAVAAAGEAFVAAVGGSLGDEQSGGLGGANACVVRCAELAADPVSGVRKLAGERLSLYVELNVAFRLMAEDADVVPQDESKGAGLVDELTVCWAMISLKRCSELVREMVVSVPLYTGSIFEPVLLSELWAEKRKQHPVRSIFSTLPTPQLTFRAGPLPTRPPPLLPYRYMPATFIAQRGTAYLLAAAKLATAQQLAAIAAASTSSSNSSAAQPHLVSGDTAAESGGGWLTGSAAAGFADAALAALPKLLDDAVLLRELLAKWDARLCGLQEAAEAESKALQADCLLSTGCAGAAGCSTVAAGACRPTQQAVLAALRTSVLELAPLLHCSSLPPAHISNFLEHQTHRAAVAARFCAGGVCVEGDVLSMGCSAAAVKMRGVSLGRHPVEVLGNATGEFVHQPFDVAETRVCLAEQLAAVRWSKC